MVYRYNGMHVTQLPNRNDQPPCRVLETRNWRWKLFAPWHLWTNRGGPFSSETVLSMIKIYFWTRKERYRGLPMLANFKVQPPIPETWAINENIMSNLNMVTARIQILFLKICCVIHKRIWLLTMFRRNPWTLKGPQCFAFFLLHTSFFTSSAKMFWSNLRIIPSFRVLHKGWLGGTIYESKCKITAMQYKQPNTAVLFRLENCKIGRRMARASDANLSGLRSLWKERNNKT